MTKSELEKEVALLKATIKTQLALIEDYKLEIVEAHEQLQNQMFRGRTVGYHADKNELRGKQLEAAAMELAQLRKR